MAELCWLARHGAQGPIFQLGDDIFVRPIAAHRLLTLDARQPLSAPYLATLTEALTALAVDWQAPILLAITPQLSAPPAARLLGQWGLQIRRSGCVERTFLVLTDRPSLTAGRLACAAMRAAGLSIEAVAGESGLARRLANMNTTARWPGWSLQPALPARRRWWW